MLVQVIQPEGSIFLLVEEKSRKIFFSLSTWFSYIPTDFFGNSPIGKYAGTPMGWFAKKNKPANVIISKPAGIISEGHGGYKTVCNFWGPRGFNSVAV